MPIVEVAGSPREIGRQTGEAWRESIARHVEILRALGNLPASDTAFWKQRLPIAMAVVQRELPLLAEELEGTADGSGQPLAVIAALNMPFYNNDLDQGCSNVAFASGPDGPLWGKCNDGDQPDGQLPIGLRVVRPEHGIPFATIVFCGWCGYGDGINAEGLAMGHSSVGSVFQQSDHHVPIRPWAHAGLMTCRTTREFVAHMCSRPLRGKGYAWIAVDRRGDACALEAPCPLVQARRAPGGHLHCVNVYQLPALASADRRSPAAKAHACLRRDMLDEQLAAEGAHDLPRMERLLRAHAKPAMCRHGGDDQGYTNYAAIGIAASGTLRYCLGPPCSGTFGAVTP